MSTTTKMAHINSIAKPILLCKIHLPQLYEHGKIYLLKLKDGKSVTNGPWVIARYKFRPSGFIILGNVRLQVSRKHIEKVVDFDDLDQITEELIHSF